MRSGLILARRPVTGEAVGAATFLSPQNGSGGDFQPPKEQSIVIKRMMDANNSEVVDFVRTNFSAICEEEVRFTPQIPGESDIIFPTLS